MPVKSDQIPVVKAVAYSLIILVVIIGGAELGLRFWANYFRTAYLTYSTEYGRPVLIANVRVNTINEKVAVNSRGFVGPEFEKKKPDKVRRIISLGDSCTFGGGWWETTYPGRLDALIKERYPANPIEVINAGISGYHSGFALDRLKTELLDYDPDMVIIYIGWNDLMKVNPMNASATDRHTELAKLINQSYLVKAYSKLIFSTLRPLVMKPALTSAPGEIDVFKDFVPIAFEENVEAMLETLKAHHIKTLVFTLPTVVRRGMTYEDLDRDHVFFPYFAGSYSIDQFLSLHHAYNAAIRKLASKHDVQLLDLDVIFDKVPKDVLFMDTMHPNATGNSFIATAVADAIDSWVRSR